MLRALGRAARHAPRAVPPPRRQSSGAAADEFNEELASFFGSAPAANVDHGGGGGGNDRGSHSDRGGGLRAPAEREAGAPPHPRAAAGAREVHVFIHGGERVDVHVHGAGVALHVHAVPAGGAA